MDGPWSSFQAAPAAAPQQEEQGPWSAFNAESSEQGPWSNFQAQEPQQPASSFGGFNMATAKKAGTQAISSSLNVVDELVKQPAMAAGVVPMAIDAIRGGISGTPTDGAKNWWFKNVVDPIVENQKTLAPKDNSIESRVGAAVGGGLGMLGEAAATGGGSLEAQGIQKLPSMMEHIQQVATHGFKGMSLPALQEATDTYDKVYQVTQDKLQAARAAFSAFTTTEASGVAPLSAPGNLGSRMLQAGASGVVTGELQREAMNTVLPTQLQTQFDPVQVGINAVTMAPLGALGPRGDHVKPAGIDTRTIDAVTDQLKQGSAPDPTLTDVDTSQARSPYQTGLGKDLLGDHTEIPATLDKQKAQLPGDMQAEMDKLAQGPEAAPMNIPGADKAMGGAGPVDINGKQVSNKTPSLSSIPDTIKLEHLDAALEDTRQDLQTKADSIPLDPDAKMQDGSDRPLTPAEQQLANRQKIEGSDLHDVLTPDAVDRFWNLTNYSKRLESLFSTPDANGRVTIDPIRAVNWLKTFSHPLLKEAAEKLAQHPELLKSLKITVLGEKEFNGYANVKGGAAGTYSRLAHEITLGHKYANDTTLAHELVHAASSRGLTVGEKMSRQFPKLGKLAKDLNSILDDLHQKGDRQFPPKVLNKDGELVQPPPTHDFSADFPKVGRGRIYGLTDVHEFLAEAFTNTSFRELLKKYGAWDNVKQTLQKALGFGTPSSLDRILELGSQVMHETNADRQNISVALRKYAAQGGITDPVKILYSPARDSIDRAMNRGLDKDPRTQAIVSKLPGGRNLNEKDIAAAPEPDKILADLKAKPDNKDTLGNMYERSFTGSGEQLSTLWRSPGMFGFTRIFDRAQKLGHLHEETVTKPLRQQIKRLIPDSNIKSLKKVMDTMHAEDFYSDAIHPDGKRLTPEQLEATLNPNERAVYKLLRDNKDRTLATMNKSLVARGMEPIKARDAYTSSSRSGPWSAEVHRDWTDSNGNKRSEMVGFIRGHSMAEVRKGTEYALKQGDNVRTTKISFNKTFNGRTDNLFEAYATASRLLSHEDPAVKGLRTAIENEAAKQGMNFEGYKKHLMEKTGLRYAEGDRPWLSDKRNVQEWYRNQLETSQHGIEWAHMQDAVHSAKQVLGDPEFNATHPNLSSYLKFYARKQLGFGKNEVFTRSEHAISELTGRLFDTIPGLKNLPADMKAATRIMRDAKTLLYMKALGFIKPQHLMINGVFQPVFCLPKHMKLTDEGYKHNPFTTLSEGIINSQAMLLNHYTQGKFPLTEHQQKLKDYINSNGVDTNNPFQDTGDIGESTYGKVGSAVRKVGGFMMQEGERIGRYNSMASFESHFRQSGKFDNPLEVMRHAEKATTEVMGSFRHTDRADIFVKAGLLGTGLATLKQFDLNFISQHIDYFKYGLETKNFSPFMALFAIQLCYAGVMGLLGFETLNSLYEHIRDTIPTNMIDKEWATWSPKKFVLEHFPTILSRGPVSDITGINFASSLDAGTIVDPTLEGALPFISEVKNTIAPAFEYATNPTKDNLHKLVWNETPYGSRGVLETGKMFGHDLPDPINTKSWYNSPTGVSQSPNNPGQGTYTRDADDTAIRSSGFTSTKEALSKEVDYINKQDDKMLQSRQQDALSNLDSAIRNNDLGSVEKSMMKYIDMQGNPTTPLSTERLSKVLVDWNTDYQTRVMLALKQGDITAVYKYQRLNDMMQQLNKRYQPQGANYGPANAAR